MTNISENLERIKKSLTEGVELVAVSKTKPASLIQDAYHSGHRIFGENRPQELKEKAEELPEDIQWHMIGHLQSNKVKYIAPFVSLIHAVDKLSLLKEINKRAKQNDRVIDVLLQIYIAREESKFGMEEEEAIELLNSDAFASYENVRVVGLMGMATNTKDEAIVRNEFKVLKAFFDSIKNSSVSTPLDLINFNVLSMGMSGDYNIAIQEGSNMVRIGSAIFGARN